MDRKSKITGRTGYLGNKIVAALLKVSGFVFKENKKEISNSAVVVVSTEGQGRGFFFADNPTFRSYWHGTSRLFLNAVLFGQHLSVPTPQVAEEEK